MGLIIWNGPGRPLFNQYFSMTRCFIVASVEKGRDYTHFVGVLRNPNIVNRGGILDFLLLWRLWACGEGNGCLCVSLELNWTDRWLKEWEKKHCKSLKSFYLSFVCSITTSVRYNAICLGLCVEWGWRKRSVLVGGQWGLEASGDKTGVLSSISHVSLGRWRLSVLKGLIDL